MQPMLEMDRFCTVRDRFGERRCDYDEKDENGTYF